MKDCEQIISKKKAISKKNIMCISIEMASVFNFNKSCDNISEEVVIILFSKAVRGKVKIYGSNGNKYERHPRRNKTQNKHGKCMLLFT